MKPNAVKVASEVCSHFRWLADVHIPFCAIFEHAAHCPLPNFQID